ncbi:MAG: glycosyltransferase [Roseburia sp.]|nr:glycosyltransferase [Roseburia sp.]
MKIDVMIPVYKPGKELFDLLERLNTQSVPIQRIILMNTEERYFEELTYGTRFMDRHRNVKVYHLSKREFDHGRTRHKAVEKSDADIFVMMTQDAMPVDSYLIEKLIQNLKGEVAVSYARQIPTQESSLLEKISRYFNYPPKACIKSAEDIETMGIKTYFCSNVCAAYRRDIYDKLGGFIRHAIFNEDMIYAAGAVKQGYQISYEPQAQVYHAHNYTNRQQFSRNFDLGVSQASHPEVFGGVRSETEGRKLVTAATAYLKKKHMLRKLPYFYIQCGCKYAGYLLGKHYRHLPMRWILAMTSNKDYWQQEC